MTSRPKGATSTTTDAPTPALIGGPGRWRFFRASASLTLANVAFSALSFVTGPILARALGPAGRGDLAAILVPVGFAAPVALLGLDVFAARQAARGRPVGTLAFSVGSLLVAMGVAVALVGIPLSALLAGDREVVRTFLLLGFALIPVALLTLLLISISSGLGRWRLVIAARVVPAVIVLIGLVILFIVGSLTVGSAAAVYLVASVATALIVVPVLRHQQFRFDRQTVRDAIPFGARAWVGTTADLANIRLDQLLMVTLVSSHELGLYAVAVSIGGFAWVMTEGMAPPLLARISAGEVGLAPRALRAGLSVIGLLTVLAAIATPLLLTVLFGSEFTDARDPSWILLAAGIPFAGTVILTQTLNGVGRPGLPAIGQAVALMITVPGLLLLLPPMGAVGAAVVSLIAYTANLMVLLVATIRTCDMSLSELLVPRRGDFSWAFELVRARLRTWRGGSEITPRAADSR